MTWEPTNELRWIKARQVVLGDPRDPKTATYVVPLPAAPRLQQKFRKEWCGNVQEEWRDVPTETEE